MSAATRTLRQGSKCFPAMFGCDYIRVLISVAMWVSRGKVWLHRSVLFFRRRTAPRLAAPTLAHRRPESRRRMERCPRASPPRASLTGAAAATPPAGAGGQRVQRSDAWLKGRSDPPPRAVLPGPSRYPGSPSKAETVGETAYQNRSGTRGTDGFPADGTPCEIRTNPLPARSHPATTGQQPERRILSSLGLRT